MSTSYMAFLDNMFSIKEPYSFKQACTQQEWISTVHKEIDALEANKTWILIDLPPRKQAIGCN